MVAAFARKIAGIIWYTEPLPRPEKMKNRMNPIRYNGSDFASAAARTSAAPSAMAMKL